MQQDYRVCGSVLLTEAPGPKRNAIVGFDRYGFEDNVVVRNAAEPRSSLRCKCPPCWVQCAFGDEDTDHGRYSAIPAKEQQKAEQLSGTSHVFPSIGTERWGYGFQFGRISAPVRGLNLFSGFTQDFRPGLLSVAPTGAVSCSADNGRTLGLWWSHFAGNGAHATQVTVNIRGQECPRHTGFSWVADIWACRRARDP